MTKHKLMFEYNIESVLILESIFIYLKPQLTAFDISEILRAEFLLIVSALDFYIHEIVREGLINQFINISDGMGASFCIPLSTVKVLLKVDSEEERMKILNGQIKSITSKDSYQAPNAIEKALGLINIKSVWSKISSITGKPADDIKKRLSLIINRRNKIAHEADIDFISGEKTTITLIEVKECREFVKMFVEVLDTIIQVPNKVS